MLNYLRVLWIPAFAGMTDLGLQDYKKTGPLLAQGPGFNCAAKT